MTTATQGSEKVRELRLRRMAERQGLALHKSRRRDPRAIDYGCWAILDADGRSVVGRLGADRPSLDLDQVEAYLRGELPAALGLKDGRVALLAGLTVREAVALVRLADQTGELIGGEIDPKAVETIGPDPDRDITGGGDA
jgi:hypothetical protein